MPSLNPLRMLSRRHDDAFSATLEEDLAVELGKPFRPNFTLIEREAIENENALESLRSELRTLEDEIADRNERLRQTQVAIRAREAQAAVLSNGDEPRMQLRGNTREMSEAETVFVDGAMLKSRNGQAVLS